MLVEGATEVEFVKRVLAQPLSDHGVAATPVSMDGDVTSDRMARELATRAHSRFPGHALTPTGVMAIRCKQFHLPDL